MGPSRHGSRAASMRAADRLAARIEQG